MRIVMPWPHACTPVTGWHGGTRLEMLDMMVSEVTNKPSHRAARRAAFSRHYIPAATRLAVAATRTFGKTAGDVITAGNAAAKHSRCAITTVR